jgi:hypothetical protein
MQIMGFSVGPIQYSVQHLYFATLNVLFTKVPRREKGESPRTNKKEGNGFNEKV